jgi:hypothetical protein
MSVRFITYNDKKYPVKLGIYSLQVLQQEHGVVLEDIEKDFKVYQPVLFKALQLGARIEKVELDLLEEDMDLVLDQCLVEFTEIFPSFFDQETLDKAEKLMEEGKLLQEKKKPLKKKTGVSTTLKSTAKR